MNRFFAVSAGVEETFRAVGEQGESVAGTRFREAEVLAEIAVGQLKVVVVAGKIRFRFLTRGCGSEMKLVQLDGVLLP